MIMINHKHWVTVSLIFFFGLLHGQSQRSIDSLLAVLDADTSDLVKVKAYSSVGYKYRLIDSAKALHYTREAFHLAKELKYDEGLADVLLTQSLLQLSYGNYDLAKKSADEALKIATEKGFKALETEALNARGVIEEYSGDMDVALTYYKKSVNVSMELQDTLGMSAGFNNIALIHYSQGNAQEALDFHYKSLDLSRGGNDLDGMGTSYSNIGIIYHDLKDYEKALEYYQKALEIGEKNNSKDLVETAKNNIAEVYMEYKAYDKALKLLEECLQLNTEMNHSWGKAISFSNIGAVYYEMHEYERALKNYEEGYRIASDLQEKQVLAETLLGIGESKLRLGRINEAEKALEKSYEYAVKSQILEIQREAAKALSGLKERLGDFKQALFFYKKYHELADSLVNQDKTRELTKMESEYAFQQEKDSLFYAQAIERAAFETDISNRKIVQRITYMSLGVVMVLLVVIFRFNRSNQRSVKQLALLNEEINDQNQAISSKNEELKETNERLQRLNRTKTRFFSIISHDLRGPINVLVGFSELIKKHLEKYYHSKEDQTLNDIFLHLQTSSFQVLHLLDSFLKWAMKEEEGIPYRPEQINLMKCLDETLEIIKAQAHAKSIRITSEVDANAEVWADKNALMTILRNLMNNAVKFTPENGAIHLKARKMNGKVAIQVIDTGVGIDDEKMDHLFEINEGKVMPGTKGEKGSGLGLNLVYDFVKMNKGQIEVNSKVDKGTTFTILLPSSSHAVIV